MEFADRETAGEALADALADLNPKAPVVLALARGGVPVGARVARRLGCPLDVVLVRKVGVPFQPELAAAAVVDGAAPDLVLNEEVMRAVGLDRAAVEALAAPELDEIARRRRAYLGDRAAPALAGRTVVLVDDGIATGTSMRAAIRAVRHRGPDHLIVAVPVAPRDTVRALERLCDRVVCLATPAWFEAVGLHYRDFHQVPDDELTALLAAAATPADSDADAAPPDRGAGAGGHH